MPLFPAYLEAIRHNIFHDITICSRSTYVQTGPKYKASSHTTWAIYNWNPKMRCIHLYSLVP